MVREHPRLTRLIVARADGRTLILHPPEYDPDDLAAMLTPAEAALLLSVA